MFALGLSTGHRETKEPIALFLGGSHVAKLEPRWTQALWEQPVLARQGDKPCAPMSSGDHNVDDTTTVPVSQAKGTEAQKTSMTCPRSHSEYERWV